MTESKARRSVLITGCSEGGMGFELAKHFHLSGLRVYATARHVERMTALAALGIITIPLDVTSGPSIEACLQEVDELDILVNNAGVVHAMPVSDLDIAKAKELFDVNFWAHVSVTKALLPLLMRSRHGMIVNHGSLLADLPLPFHSAYAASKGALAMFSKSLRMELQPFGIAVVDLKTGGTGTKLSENGMAKKPCLPESSIFASARVESQQVLDSEYLKIGMPADEWARQVVKDLLKEDPPFCISRGNLVLLAWLSRCFSEKIWGSRISGISGFNRVIEIIVGGPRGA